VVPKVLHEVGVVGPSVEEEIERAASALDAARAYGAQPEEPAFREAYRGIDRARELLRNDKGREARGAARRAQERAVDAQRVALAQHEVSRRAAERAVLDADRLMGELEELYRDASAHVPRAEGTLLFASMKDARQAVATLSLAYQEESFRKVLDDAPAVETLLRSVGERLRETAARAQRSRPPAAAK
jgi:hypothetical protein